MGQGNGSRHMEEGMELKGGVPDGLPGLLCSMSLKSQEAGFQGPHGPAVWVPVALTCQAAWGRCSEIQSLCSLV